MGGAVSFSPNPAANLVGHWKRAGYHRKSEPSGSGFFTLSPLVSVTDLYRLWWVTALCDVRKEADVQIGMIRQPQSAEPRNPLIIVSNRGPFEHYRDGNGALARRPAGGGVAIALSALLGRRELVWIAGAMTETDRELVSRGLDRATLENGHQLRFVAAPVDSFDLFYRTFSNPVLWFLQHSLWHLLDGRAGLQQQIAQSWEDGYLPANEAFADAVVEEIGTIRGVPRVMFHDYHLCLAPRYVRSLCPEALLQHFIHIPWPGPEAWEVLPRFMVRAMCEGLLANDSVFFQTSESRQNFVLTCLAYLPGAFADLTDSALTYRGRSIGIAVNPVSVDVFDLRRQLASPVVMSYQGALAGAEGLSTIVRVDRLDPSKNILVGFQAFELLLERHPEWIGRVRFLAFLVPSRDGIPEYQRYRDEVLSLIREINSRYGSGGWQPIALYHEENRPQALAGLSLYDVLIANSLADGMNLVVKEGPIINQRDGVVVLSTRAGAFQELSGGALAIEPEEIDGTAEALQRALVMSAEERRERALTLRRAVARHDVNRWLEVQMAAFKERRPAQALPLAPLMPPPSRQEPPALIVGGIP